MGARFASQVVWDAGDSFGTELEVANMFKHRVDAIHVQNHSWGSSSIEQLDVPEIEAVAIDEAIENGRDGKGVIMVRVTGNNRSSDWSAADDGYSNDPRVVNRRGCWGRWSCCRFQQRRCLCAVCRVDR